MVVFNIKQTDTEKKTELIDVVHRYLNAEIGYAGCNDLFFVKCRQADKEAIQREIKNKKLGTFLIGLRK